MNSNTLKDKFDLSKAVESDKQLINKALEQYLEERYPYKLWESMKYTTLCGGKRLRSILLLESARVCGGCVQTVLPTACALEMLHAQSLIHDDLPCMDNDDFRRGKPTNHKVFGEANAVLAGDALLSYGPQIIIEKTSGLVDSDILLMIVKEFLQAAGPSGIVGGQVVDIESENKKIDTNVFDYILNHKTGELFKFAMRAGALLSGASADKLYALASYGEKIGYAFQIADDILDVEGNLQEMGKTPGKDLTAGKNTYVSFYGTDKAKQDLDEIVEAAIQVLQDNNIKSDLLSGIADYIRRKR